ncbi:MAG: NAD(P)H-binding protein [Acidobacteriota bacterium]|nr:NAD(P)H-binding protein [Acidobacteriota bacterium]
MNLLVTGATGHLGRDVVSVAMAAGHSVRIASRRARGSDVSESIGWAKIDLATGEGLREALANIDAIVHAASDPKNAAAADVEGTRRLIDEAHRSVVKHLVYVSIVGIDRIPFPYYQRKLAVERVIAEAGFPHSILRATQFHVFIDRLLEAACRVPFLLPLPLGFHVQSVATEDVAHRLLRALEAGPQGLLRDFAGPEPMTVAEAAAAWKTARRIRKPIISIPAPGRTAAAFRAGYNIAPDGERGTVRWRDWLVRKYPATRSMS